MTDSTTTPEPYDLNLTPLADAQPLTPIPDQIQLVMAAWVPGHGWLVTRRGVIYGGKHGQPPLLSMPENELLEIVDRETHSAIRAMQHAHRKATLNSG